MAYQVGPISQTLVTASAASLFSPEASGGTGPYTYQWYRSTDPLFVPSVATLLPAQTDLTILDGPLSQNSIYYYIIQATDTGAGNAKVNSLPFGICTTTKGQSLYQNPSITQFQNFFDRDFPYGTDMNKAVRQQDILKGFFEANTQINQLLYLSQASYTMGYLYLSAHLLATNLQNSSQGINGQYNWLQASKGVGPVSEGFVIPEQISKYPYFASLSKTTYGQKYIADLLPRMTGPMASVFGNTKA